MTEHRDHDAVVQLLDRAISAASPRDPDPVGSVVRRARARRRRMLVTTSLLVLGVAGVGLAGALLTGQGDNLTKSVPADQTSPSPAASPDLSNAVNLRVVAPWTGEMVTFHGVHVPVPSGWRVRHTTTPGQPCADFPRRTLLVLDTATVEGVCEGTAPDVIQIAMHPWVGGGVMGPNPVAIDPSGQPVWLPALPIMPGMSFPWLGVTILSAGNTPIPAQFEEILSSVRADPAQAHPGLQLPHNLNAISSYRLFGGTSRKTAHPSGTADARAIAQVLRTSVPDDQLRCVPKVGALVSLQSTDQTLDYPAAGIEVMFDTTGTCHQVTDNYGGLATLSAAGLRDLRDQVGAGG